MGSRISLCFSLRKKIMTQEDKYKYTLDNQILNNMPAIPHILLESDKENPSQVGTVMTEV